VVAASTSQQSKDSSQSSLGRAFQQDLDRGRDVPEAEGSPAEELDRERDRARQIKFMELLQSNMQQRQQARQQGGGALTGPSLAAALVSGARKKKVRCCQMWHMVAGCPSF
jgi:hypothetical protein